MDKHVKEYLKQVNQTRIMSGGRLTLPKRVREALDVKQGDSVRFFIDGAQVLIRAATSSHDFSGVMQCDGSPAPQGRLTLPKPVQQALDVKPGDSVRFFIHRGAGEVQMRAVHSVHRLYGSLAYDGPPATLEDMDRSVAEGRAGYGGEDA